MTTRPQAHANDLSVLVLAVPCLGALLACLAPLGCFGAPFGRSPGGDGCAFFGLVFFPGNFFFPGPTAGACLPLACAFFGPLSGNMASPLRPFGLGNPFCGSEL